MADIYNQKKVFLTKFDQLLKDFYEDDREEIKNFCLDSIAQGLKPARVLKYIYTLRPLSRELKKPFTKLTENDIRLLFARIEGKGYSEWTIHDMRSIFRKFMRYIGKGELVSWIKVRDLKNNKLPSEILTEEEIKRMAEVAYTTRDKAFVLALYESGCRIGEFLTLKLKHITFDEFGAILHVSGKTGDRRIRLVVSSVALQRWIEEHPFKSDQEAYVWCTMPSPNNPKLVNRHLSYGFICRLLKELASKAGIKKKVNPHAFRHARATFLANYLTEAQMKEFFGWVQASKMAEVYVHLSGRDVDNALLNVYGIREGAKAKEPKIKLERCPRCGEVIDPSRIFCQKCWLPVGKNESATPSIDRIERVLVRLLGVIAEEIPTVKEEFVKIVREEGLDYFFDSQR